MNIRDAEQVFDAERHVDPRFTDARHESAKHKARSLFEKPREHAREIALMTGLAGIAIMGVGFSAKKTVNFFHERGVLYQLDKPISAVEHELATGDLSLDDVQPIHVEGPISPSKEARKLAGSPEADASQLEYTIVKQVGEGNDVSSQTIYMPKSELPNK